MRRKFEWSSFAEREIKGILDWQRGIVHEDGMVFDIRKACLREIGYKYIWWER